MDIDIQALFASIIGASYEWLCPWTVSIRGVFGRLRVRPGRLRDGLCRIRYLAAHHYSYSDGWADRRLRPLHSRLWRVDVAPDTELAEGHAVHRWRGDWCPARGGAAHLCQPGLCALRRRLVAGSL